MNRKALVFAAVGVVLALTMPASAWRGGTTPSGGHYAAGAEGGHWGGSWNGHTASGTYGTTSSGEHYATSSRGGSMEAQNGSWSATSASGKTDYGSYGTTSNGTHYATGAYGGTMAQNGQYWGASKNGEYAYGTTGYHGGGSVSGYGSYNGAYHPPATVNNYYGTGCWNCGGWSTVNNSAAFVGGVAAGTVVGAAAASAAAANANAAAYAPPPPPVSAYAMGTIYAVLPAGCLYQPSGGHAYYLCSNTWFSPYYGANGTYYRVVANPI